VPRGWGVGRGFRPRGEVPRRGHSPSPEKNLDFGSQIGEFWCKLDAFYTVHLKLV